MATHNKIYIAPYHTKNIFANLRRQRKDFSSRVTPLFPIMVVQAQEEMGEGSAMPTDPHHIPIITQPSSSQPQRKQKSRRPKEKDAEIPQSSVPSDPTNVADEAINEKPSIQLKELMDFYTKLQQRVLDLENTKTAQAQEITSLKKRDKNLEKKGGSRTHKLKRLYRVGRSARVVSSKEASLGNQEDASKQERKIHDIDADEDITLENVVVNDLDGDEVVVESEVTDKASEKRNIVEEAAAVTDVVTIPVSTEMKESSKKAEVIKESSSKRAGDELQQESTKKKKKDDDQERAELQSLMNVIPDEEEVAVDAMYRNLDDQIIVPVPDSSLHCAVCGTPVDGPYCHGCTLVRKKFDEDFAWRIVLIMEFLQNFSRYFRIEFMSLKDKVIGLSIDKIRKIIQEENELRIIEACVDDDDTDDDDDYDDDVYVDDCVDIEEDGGEIDLDISKIVDISLREKCSQKLSFIDKNNAFVSLLPYSDFSYILPLLYYPRLGGGRDSGRTLLPIDDLPLDDSMILSEYESFTFDDEPVMAEVNDFDEINTSELSYTGIGENVVLDEEEILHIYYRSLLHLSTYPARDNSTSGAVIACFPDFGRFTGSILWKKQSNATIYIDVSKFFSSLSGKSLIPLSVSNNILFFCMS
ncbi:hypothetical protein Tco_0596038 [Tanacetum coccineum]